MANEQIVAKEFVGQRLDNFLFRTFRRAPKSRVYKMLRKGEVRVNGSRKKQDYRIQEGDRIRLPPIHLVEADDADEQLQVIPRSMLQKVESAVLFEDDDLLVLNKPQRIAVHSGSGVDFGVIEILRQLRPAAPFLELVHRLDRDTSGCLLLAKNRQTLTDLHALLRDGGVEKHYLTLLAGNWQGGGRRVDTTLARTGQRGEVRRTVQDDDGKDAVSQFTPQQRFGMASLMDVQIFTGRTHQIRVHAADLHYPVLGDDKYGDFTLNREWKKRGLKRLFLHCRSMRFALPTSGKKYDFCAPLADDLQRVLTTLEAQ